MLFYTWSTNKFHQANQINSAGNTLFKIRTESHKIIYPVYDREVNTHTWPAAHFSKGHIRRQSPSPLPHRPTLNLKLWFWNLSQFFFFICFVETSWQSYLSWGILKKLILHFGYEICNKKPGVKFSFYKNMPSNKSGHFHTRPIFSSYAAVYPYPNLWHVKFLFHCCSFMKLKMSVRVAQDHFPLRHASLKRVINLPFFLLIMNYSKLCGIAKCTLNTSFLLTMNYSKLCGIAKCTINWLNTFEFNKATFTNAPC